jgi:hypothetical protein
MRPIGCVVIAFSLVAGVIGCGSPDTDYDDDYASVSVEGISPDVFVDTAGNAWCVYPDDMDELDGVDGIVNDAIVGAYCGEVFDSMGNPVAQQYWVEADEPDNFVDTDTSMSTLLWIYYLTYLNDWYLSAMFMNAYMPSHVHSAYKTKHSGYSTKYSVQVNRYAPLGAYHTRRGVYVARDQLNSGKYKIAPARCKLVAYDGEGVQFAPAALQATTKPRVPTKPKPKVTTKPKTVAPPKTTARATQPTAVTGTKPSNGPSTKSTYVAPNVSATKAC